MKTGPQNLITDIAGFRVGNAEDQNLKSGATVLVGDAPFTAGVHVMGGAPGTRETDLLAPDKTIRKVDALVLSGGSAFGLDAASGVADALRAAGRGFEIGTQTVPIVPAAILFDLINGGDKNWHKNPYRNLGARAFENATDHFDLGSCGAGTGATTASFKGGLGSASVITPNGYKVGALVAVNALGDVVVPNTRHFWAAPWEIKAEFGGHGITKEVPGDWPRTKLDAQKTQDAQNTTIAIVATDADLSQAQCTRMSIAAHDGMARAIVPSHTPMDGDLVFGVSTNSAALRDDVADPIYLGHAAATCLARAIARAIFAASPAAQDILPTYHEIHTGIR